MKIILFVPNSYTFKTIFKEGFKKLGHEIKTIHYEDFFSPLQNLAMRKTSGIPLRFRKYWYYSYYIKNINKQYEKIVLKESPDLLLTYNDQLLLPQTARKIKKNCPFFVFLGDNPFYLENRPYCYDTFMEADHIFSPDTFWIKQLKQIGIKNISHLLLGYCDKLNYISKPNDVDIRKFSSEIVFIGRNYRSSWGFKRALFLSKLVDLDLIIYGKNWNIRFDRFPDLKDKYIPLSNSLSNKEINTILNCCKIYPIDANPGLIYGIHQRIFDCIGSGIMPLAEFREDMDLVFNGVELPSVNNYNDLPKKCKYYLNHDSEREKIIQQLRYYIQDKYTPSLAMEQIIDKLNN